MKTTRLVIIALVAIAASACTGKTNDTPHKNESQSRSADNGNAQMREYIENAGKYKADEYGKGPALFSAEDSRNSK